MKDSHVNVSGERELAYTDIGEPGWFCVLFFHGAPSSRLRFAAPGNGIRFAAFAVLKQERVAT